MIIRIKKKLFYMARPKNCPVKSYQLAIVCLSGGGGGGGGGGVCCGKCWLIRV